MIKTDLTKTGHTLFKLISTQINYYQTPKLCLDKQKWLNGNRKREQTRILIVMATWCLKGRLKKLKIELVLEEAYTTAVSSALKMSLRVTIPVKTEVTNGCVSMEV